MLGLLIAHLCQTFYLTTHNLLNVSEAHLSCLVEHTCKGVRISYSLVRGVQGQKLIIDVIEDYWNNIPDLLARELVVIMIALNLIFHGQA